MQNQLQLHSPKTRFPQEVPVPAGNSSGIPHSNPQVLCYFWLLQLSTFFITCLKCSLNTSAFSNPLHAPIFLPTSPGIPQLSLPQEQFISRLRPLNPCRKASIFRLPWSPFLQQFQASNWLKTTCRVCKGLVKWMCGAQDTEALRLMEITSSLCRSHHIKHRKPLKCPHSCLWAHGLSFSKNFYIKAVYFL